MDKRKKGEIMNKSILVLSSLLCIMILLPGCNGQQRKTTETAKDTVKTSSAADSDSVSSTLPKQVSDDKEVKKECKHSDSPEDVEFDKMRSALLGFESTMSHIAFAAFGSDILDDHWTRLVDARSAEQTNKKYSKGQCTVVLKTADKAYRQLCHDVKVRMTGSIEGEFDGPYYIKNSKKRLKKFKKVYTDYLKFRKKNANKLSGKKRRLYEMSTNRYTHVINDILKEAINWSKMHG